jgi:indole-3-glycerol phosphate synthase
LEQVASNCPIPILCKDFLIHPEQIAKAAGAGADAVLLIVAALKEETAKFVQIAHLFGLEALVEVHHEKELKTALDSGADIIGVNQRDLTDFTMHPKLFEKLVDKIPMGQVKIAESGIGTITQAYELFAMGYDAVLVGEALSKKTFFEVAHVH